MKKSNVILTALIAVASAFLLWLWFNLGFNNVDAPLDLVLSVVWWAIVLVGVGFAVKTEKTRQESVRTVYVGDGRYYNSETGVRMMPAGSSASDSIATVLANLEYGFDREDAPDPNDEENPANWTHVIRTSKYEPARDDDGEHKDETWEGEVVVVETGKTIPFDSRSALATIIG